LEVKALHKFSFWIENANGLARQAAVYAFLASAELLPNLLPGGKDHKPKSYPKTHQQGPRKEDTKHEYPKKKERETI
jgi:hypothetical protein